MHQKFLSLRCQYHLLSHPIKQARSKLLFQYADLDRHRRLRITKLNCRPGKALKLCSLNKSLKLTKFHKTPPYN